MNAADPPASPSPFPWDEALAIGFGVLRLSPRDFWAMSPRELAAAMRGLFGEIAAPLDRAAFDELASRFPDGGKPESKGEKSKISICPQYGIAV